MLKPTSVSTKQRRIAKLARQAPDMAMDLSHHMDLEWFEEAYRRTRKDGAVGVDGETAQAYAQDLQRNLQELIDRAKSGRYRAPPVKRVHIPKGSGKETRPIGIPTFEDKVLQRAVAMALEPVYEQDFLDCSYGFRPKRSQHQALESLRKGLMELEGGYLIDLDIRRYFDTVDHRRIQQILRQRVRDGVIRRLIGKWLNAGVMEQRRVSYPEEGVPQGGVISPLLSNIYLHEVLDTWFEHQVKPRLKGKAQMIRFADDAILAFERRDDAERVHRVLAERFESYGLTLHPDKTKLWSCNEKVDTLFRLPRQHAPHAALRSLQG
jgi:RNA-directed DNA polymerase